MVGGLPKVSEQIREKRRPSDDDLLQILGNLARHCEQEVRVLAEVVGDPADGCLGRRRRHFTLNLAQVGRFNTDPLRDLAQ